MSPRLPSRAASRVEWLEHRIAPALLFVGKASNFTVTTDTGPAGLSTGDTVTFAPDPNTGSDHSIAANLIFGTRAFTDIPAAVTAAVNGDTIRVATGTFTVPTTIAKTLTFLGNRAGDDARESRTNVANESVINLTASALSVNATCTFNGFQFETGASVAQGVKGSLGGDQWLNNRFLGGFGIELRNVNSPSRLEHNFFDVTGVAISVPSQLSKTTIFENEIRADGIGIDLLIANSGKDIRVESNFLRGNAGAGTGLRLGPAFPANGDLVVKANFFFEFAIGVHLQGNVPGTVTVRANSLNGSTLAIQYDGATQLDAPFNFYGPAADTAPEVDALINGPVDFEPFVLFLGLEDRDSNVANGMQPRLEQFVPLTGTSFTYTDVDGDTVKVAVTRGDLDTDYAVALDAADFGKGLQLASLSMFTAVTAGTDVLVTVARGPFGNGFADVGRIATNNDLGKVIVRGDLAAISAGDGTPETPAVKLLQVQSMGRGVFAPVEGFVNGRIPLLQVKTDFSANLSLHGAAGTIDKLVIGGSLAALPGELNTGRIVLSQNLGTGTILGGIRASTAGGTGVLDVGGTLGNLTVTGGVTGGDGNFGPFIHVGGSAKTIALKGGMPAVRGQLIVDGSLDNLIVTGDFAGIGSIGGSMKKAVITGDLGLPFAPALGAFSIDGSAGTVLIGGSILRGEFRSGGSVGSITIGGDVNGVSGGILDGVVSVGGSVRQLKIRGSLIGGEDFDSGSVDITGFAGAVSIGGSLIGGGDFDSGSLKLSAGAGTVFVGGSLLGGLDVDSGQVSIAGNVVRVTVRGSIVGGQDFEAGFLEIRDIAGTVFVGGSVIGGTDLRAGNVEIRKAKTVTIGGSLIGGTGAFSGGVTIQEGLNNLRILGDVLANANTPEVMLDLGGVNGSVFIGGDVVGARVGTTIRFPGLNAPADQAGSVVVKTLTIRGSVSDAVIEFGGGVNADVSAGTVSIGGDFLRSSIALGINRGADSTFDTADDIVPGGGQNPDIVATLARLIIGGSVSGDPLRFVDRQVIIAQRIGSIVIGGQALALTPGLDNLLIGASLDVRVREF